jgi:zinc/manganese transport system substrate-binding protein
MKKMFVLAALGALCLPALASLKVVTTIPDLADIARQVGGNRVSVTNIASGLEDPHFIEAKPSYMLKMRNADLFIEVGMELEKAWSQPLMQGARNSAILPGGPGFLDASIGISKLEVPTGTVDRSMGDIHPYGNPHYWTDPYNGRIIAKAIRDRLIRLDSAGKSTYEANYGKFVEDLDGAMFGKVCAAAVGGDKLWSHYFAGDLDAWLAKGDHRYGGWLGMVKKVKGTKIVTYHRSWSYFARRFGFDVVEELEPKPGIQPSPGHVLDVIKIMKQDGAKIILMEPFYSRKPADLVAGKVNGTVVLAANSVGGQPAAKDYIAMIDNVVTKLVEAAK